MKQIIYLSFLLLLLSCSNKNKNAATIEAQLKIDAKDLDLVAMEPYNWIGIYDINSLANVAIDTLKMNRKGIVNDTVAIKKDGLYLMTIGQNQTIIYLAKGNKLKFTADYFNFTKTLKFEDDFSDINTFYAKNSAGIDSLFLDADNWIALNEADFLKKIPTVEAKSIEIINANSNGINDTIVANSKIDAKYLTAKLYFTYLYKHHYFTETKYIASQKMLDYSKNYDFNTPEYLKKSRIYGEIAYQYYWQNYQKTATESVVPAVKGFDAFLSKQKVNIELKEYLLTYRVINFDIKPDSKQHQEAINYIKEHVKNKSYVNDVEKLQRTLF